MDDKITNKSSVHKEAATLPPKRGKIKSKIFEDIKETVIYLIGMGNASDSSSAAPANQQPNEKKKA
ncbi:hypothetical protein D8674_001054 [Pyrus ussuriensis x Pyrus communis]|uniref:Uncharacterized protein n=1 Tax=Pyrus ussuriensis x Pyrus communis TaxID=2448454 RepID=A0A5N5FIC8_9ROSA|nr:hypothetical protein D8674_001054 [Pyrus ussuriensis x Pyrus communis]